MAITTVRAKINGVWTNLTYNEDTEMYEGTITAPSITSFNIPGGYYPVTIEATNDAGTTETKDDTDVTIGESLRLVVKEKIKPVITLQSPTNGAYIQNNIAPVVFTVTDEISGSGVKESSIILTFDGSTVSLTKVSVDNGYQCTYTPAQPLQDGVHTIIIEAQDNDGNIADLVSSSYTVDTVPPTLNISSPTFTITNNPVCIVSGTTNDATSSPVSVQITLNGVDAGAIEVTGDGNFSKELTLSEGANTIIITSTDASGRETVIEKDVKLDTTIPEITNIKFEPNPVDTSQLVRITLQVR